MKEFIYSAKLVAPSIHLWIPNALLFNSLVWTALPLFSLIKMKMVFAHLQETMSGGNFHGEYPAKVIQISFNPIHFIYISIGP